MIRPAVLFGYLVWLDVAFKPTETTTWTKIVATVTVHALRWPTGMRACELRSRTRSRLLHGSGTGDGGEKLESWHWAGCRGCSVSWMSWHDTLMYLYNLGLYNLTYSSTVRMYKHTCMFAKRLKAHNFRCRTLLQNPMRPVSTWEQKQQMSFKQLPKRCLQRVQDLFMSEGCPNSVQVPRNKKDKVSKHIGSYVVWLLVCFLRELSTIDSPPLGICQDFRPKGGWSLASLAITRLSCNYMTEVTALTDRFTTRVWPPVP